MNKIPLLAFAVIILSGCAEDYHPRATQYPATPAEAMQAPCVLQYPSYDSDEDLSLDVQNADCTRKLRLQVYQLQGYIRNILNP